MKKTLLIIFILSFFKFAYANDNLLFYVEAALKNNPKLNAERKNLKATQEDINISRSEFLPSVTISGSQTSTESFNRTNETGAKLNDTNLNTETKSISIDQKIFDGFQNYNSLKKSKLEEEKAKYKLKNIEQEIIFESSSALYDLIFYTKNKNYNLLNVDLFERQVETDKARLQKGEINLNDLAQSESSLAGANAELIKAETNLLNAKTNFEKITRLSIPKEIDLNSKINLKLPISLNDALKLADKNSPNLIIAKINSLISEKELNIEKAKLSPKAALNYTKSENDDFSSSINSVDTESVKATISWPIIKGGKNFSTIKKFIYKKDQNLLLFQEAENNTKSETTNAWSNYQSSEGILSATEAQLKAAEIANEGITLEYDSGNTRTTLEVIQSRSLLLDARIAFAKAERDFMISKFELAFQLGTLSSTSIKSL